MVQSMVLGMLLYLMVLSLSLMRTTSCVDHARMSGQAAVHRARAKFGQLQWPERHEAAAGKIFFKV